MKRITTILCCALLMVAGISLAVFNEGTVNHQTVMAAPPLQWNVQPGTMPLDIKLDLDKRLSGETPKVKDSVNIIDSVRYITKVRWKTRYKNEADRTTAREVGTHPMAVTPDSLLEKPTITSTMGREEKPIEGVGVPKTPSIQLTVDGEVVYSRNDNHSTEEGQ